MTAPPEKATDKALLRLVRAAWVVRTLALVATRMPKIPESPEQKAPQTKEMPMSQWLLSREALLKARRTATATTKMARTLYSLARKAMAPSWM